ncbi:Alginate biosynthesis protein AlgA [Paenibacillus solanacearum]|uniref:Alginate biosynthesis protein AlgA n=1 Tax=Paenibacillus solanacearum TaxID=2048548 RepID=A0A916NZ01_9BACL|nr:sugar phosphate nucleotidyltransferase [Paenibacillus solanacearum]CAG7653037.1 Alginate biosynthesis protein AlgA [Paenibacillus solanacearum]
MKLILLSGGSGKRLWPLSNDSRSKQFLKVLKNKDNVYESMLQRVWRQLKAKGLDKDTYIATSKSQVETLISQIGPDVPLIIEPERRDTFPAIVLSSMYLLSKKVGMEEVVCVLPVDPYVEDEFFDHLTNLESALNHNIDIALVGVKPTYPSEKYGYILTCHKEINPLSQQTLQVKEFIEKPNEEKAKELINQNAYWNCGVFGFKLNYMYKFLQDKGIGTNYDELVNQYHFLKKISFDYEVVENANKVGMIAFNGMWKDLGTWNTLTEEMKNPVYGVGISTLDSINTHIVNELDIPVTIIGLSNIVVASSPDGILVADKKESPRIKEVMNEINNRPMYEERRWGSYKVIDYSKAEDGTEVLTKRIIIKPGKNSSYHVHYKRDEVWTITAGSGTLFVNGIMHNVSKGDSLTIPRGTRHAVYSKDGIEFIEIQMGEEVTENDKVQFGLDWIEIISNKKINIREINILKGRLAKK